MFDFAAFDLCVWVSAKKKKVMKKNFHRPYNLVFVPFNFHDKDPYSPSELIPVPTESDLAHEVCMLILDTNKL